MINIEFHPLRCAGERSSESALFTQPYEKSSYEFRNCFFRVDQLGLEPRTSRL